MTRRTIPLSEPNLTGNEVKYVVNAVKTGWVSSAGPYVTEFEQRIAAYVQAKGLSLARTVPLGFMWG